VAYGGPRHGFQVSRHVCDISDTGLSDCVTVPRYVASGPLVRSSYRAGELYLKGMLEGDNVAR
jgi:hypothetical protein